MPTIAGDDDPARLIPRQKRLRDRAREETYQDPADDAHSRLSFTVSGL
jgi:hypothetical protein